MNPQHPHPTPLHIKPQPLQQPQKWNIVDVAKNLLDALNIHKSIKHIHQLKQTKNHLIETLEDLKHQEILLDDKQEANQELIKLASAIDDKAEKYLSKKPSTKLQKKPKRKHHHQRKYEEAQIA